MDGIAKDIYGYLLSLINGQQGVQQHLVTQGLGVCVRILENVKNIRPAVTLVNNGSATCYIGFGGVANATGNGFPLPVGASITLRWVNPAARNLVVYDNSAIATVDVIG